MAENSRKLEKIVASDLSAIGLKIDELIGRNSTNQHTRSSLRDIRSAIDELHDKLSALTTEIDQLTKREVEVLSAMSSGLTAAEIAKALSVSEPTVKTHTLSIYRKLKVNNRTRAIAEGRRLGLLAAK